MVNVEKTTRAAQDFITQTNINPIIIYYYMFKKRLLNRLKMPTKHILVLEDVLKNQSDIAEHFSDIFEHEGDIQVSYVCGGNAGAGVIMNTNVDIIILDTNMPDGDAFDFLPWLKTNHPNIPVITFSGIDANNIWLMQNGATHKFFKHEVINGNADGLIKELIR